MDGTRPILIAYDGSDLSRMAIHCAGAMFAGRDAVVLHVYEPMAPVIVSPIGAAAMPAGGGPLQLDEQVAENARRRAADIAEHGAQEATRAGLSACADTAFSSRVADAIVDAAKTRDAALIVVGSHGRSAIAAALLGSVSTAVLHRSAVPVLVVPARPAAD
jgi:nucleotide-binding universal stress UspA family protein